jgi:hypothetical protein
MNHSYLLDSVMVVDMKTIMGCPNWVVKILNEISALQAWKASAEINRKLSIIELATRGGVIIHALNERVVQLDNTEQRNDTSDKVSEGDQGAERVTTLAFALAAMIYLHVVKSGPSPHLEGTRTVVPDWSLVSNFVPGKG